MATFTIISTMIQTSLNTLFDRFLANQTIPRVLGLPLPPRFWMFMGTLAGIVLLACVLVIIIVTWKRQQVRRQLERHGFPTRLWWPQFATFSAASATDTRHKLAASTITNVLPRMQRLGGPYGMYGTVYGITPVIHVADRVPARAVLLQTTQQQRHEQPGACKAPAYNHFKNFCGDGVFTADGLDWKAKRAQVVHALFRDAQLDDKVAAHANLAAGELVRRIRTASHNGPCNVVPILQRTTIAFIYRFLTHQCLESDDDDDNVTPPRPSPPADESSVSSCSASSTPDETDASNLKTTNDDDNLVSRYLRSITRIRLIILAQSRSIWNLVPRWCYRRFSSLYQEEEQTLVAIRQLARQAIQHARLDASSPLAKLQQHALYRGMGDDTTISQNLLDEAITLLFAGQDTSAATLSWALHLLSLHPEIQHKLAHEVQTVVGGAEQDDSKGGHHHDDDFLTKRTLAHLPYLDAVIKESMRLYPVAPFVVRSLSQSVALPDKNLVLPAGSVVCIWIYGMHRNPTYWFRPDDFVPERWLGRPAPCDDGMHNSNVPPAAAAAAAAYMPFAAGPRKCVGQPLADVVVRVLLAQLLRQFEFVDPRLLLLDDDDGTNATRTAGITAAAAAASRHNLRKEMQAGFTVLPLGGVDLWVRPR